MSGEPEMHKSMIDGKERPGIKGSGKMESNPDENPATFKPEDAEKSKSEGSSKPGTGSSNPPPPTGSSNAPPSTDASSATKTSGTSADTDAKPAAGQPQSTNEMQQDQNKNPMSNANEPNEGYGGAGAQPSVGADISKETSSSGTDKAQGSDQPKAEPDSKDDNKEGGAPKKLGDDSKGSSGGQTGPGGMKLPDSESKEEGTGEKWEKSTGVKADGGDFDATRPGAGKEADRLMEQKGITHGEPKKPEPVEEHHHKSKDEKATEKGQAKAEEAHDRTIPGSDPDKKGLLDKLKDKIHHHEK